MRNFFIGFFVATALIRVVDAYSQPWQLPSDHDYGPKLAPSTQPIDPSMSITKLDEKRYVMALAHGIGAEGKYHILHVDAEGAVVCSKGQP